MGCKFSFCNHSLCELENTCSQGLRFRWVACQLDSLNSCLTVPHLSKALASLPKTLDETYERILSNIDEDNSEYVHRILQWLTFSAIPLHLDELADIVAIDVGQQPRFDPQRRCPIIKDILEPFSSLVTMVDVVEVETWQSRMVAEEEGHTLREFIQMDTSRSRSFAQDGLSYDVIVSGSPYVRLAHFSVKEYLISRRIRSGRARSYGLEVKGSNGFLAEDCLAYLLQIDRTHTLSCSSLQYYPLALYAAKFWFKHAVLAGEDTHRIAFLSRELLLENEGAMTNWLRVYTPDYPNILGLGFPDTRVESPLYYASILGLSRLVKSLIDDGADVNAFCEGKGGDLPNALCAAIWAGHKQVIGILLHAGANIRPSGEKLLRKAAEDGPENIIRSLLDLGVDIDSRDTTWRLSPLMNAVSSGRHLRHHTVRLLLSKGADVDLQNCYGQTALMMAAVFGWEDEARLLLQYGADPHVRCDLGQTALSLAAACSDMPSEELVLLLLNHETKLVVQSDTDARHKERTLAVRAAQARNCNGMIPSSPDDAMYPWDLDRNGRTVLHHASTAGNVQIMEILFRHGGDLLVLDKQGRNCLHHAAMGQFKDDSSTAVRWLLDEYSFDPNRTDRDGWTALHWAAFSGTTDVMRTLKDAGARSSIENIRGWTPEMVAAFSKYEIRLCSLRWDSSCVGCDCVSLSSSDYCLFNLMNRS